MEGRARAPVQPRALRGPGVGRLGLGDHRRGPPVWAAATEQVARYKLGAALSEASPYLLLLSATPHQGKTDPFHRLLS